MAIGVHNGKIVFMAKNVTLSYGRRGLEIQVPNHTDVITPNFLPGFENEEEAIRHSLNNPIESSPLFDKVNPGDQVIITHSDITRATPNKRLLPIIISELEAAGIPSQNITLLNALGTHRPSPPAELTELLGEKLTTGYRCIQHDAFKPENLINYGVTSFGNPVRLNKHLLESDVRIYTGFIEPHLFAGFSGGPKSVLPALSGYESVQSNHSQKMLNDPLATWGITEGNPVWEEMKEVALMTDPTFLVNVTLNAKKAITGVFSGDLLSAHRLGCQFTKKNAISNVDHLYDVVITTNSGYPLDQNLYQSVKGISAAARIVRPGGAILLISACEDGVPVDSNYARLLKECRNPTEALEMISQPGFSQPDQWQIQIQAQIQKNADVFVYSEGLTPDEITSALFTPVTHLPDALTQLTNKYGDHLCVMPDGPLTIPTLIPRD